MNLTHYILILFCASTITVGCTSKKQITSTKKDRVSIVNKTSRNTNSSKTDAQIVTSPTNAPVKVEDTPKNTTYAEAVTNYISYFSNIAKEEMIQYGIPASIKLAQGILESGAGRGSLSQKAQNHFGIKCHTQWTGERVYHDDDEAQECFRKYTDPKYSYRDHSLFLTSRSRYQSLFTLAKDDYKGWAKGLKKAGYATDPKYPNKLINIIERYNLSQYDMQVLQNGSLLTESGSVQTSLPSRKEPVKTYTVVKGDTLYNIARRYNMTVETLKAYNGLNDASISIGQTLYLHPVIE